MADWMLVLLPLLALPIVLLFRFVGCGELLSSSPSPEPPFDFSVAVDPVQVTVSEGSSISAKVTVTGSGGYNKEVTLKTLPAPSGWTVALVSSKANPAPGPEATTLTVTIPVTGVFGSSGITIEGRGAAATPPPPPPGSPPSQPPDELVRNAILTIITTAAAPAVPDFELQLSPPTLQVTRPNAAMFTVTIARTGGFADAVDLDILVNGMVQPFGGFNPDPIPPTATSSMVTAPTATVPPGTYTFAVRGRGQNTGITHPSNGATLTVV